jgi:hypothetical protein
MRCKEKHMQEISLFTKTLPNYHIKSHNFLIQMQTVRN